MAQYAQIPRNSGYIDRPCYNNSATAIPAGYCVNGEAAEVAGHGELCVELPTNGGGSALFVGVTTTEIPAYGYGNVCIHGPALVYSHSVLVPGDVVQVYDATSHLGEVIKHLLGSTLEAVTVVGWCMTPAAADGDLCQVFVDKSVSTTTA